MESLLNFQEDLSSRIFKARVNFKKSPKDRLTKDYIESRLESLELLWSEFRQGHKDLMQKVEPKSLKEQSYITKDVYENTENEFTDFKCELKHSLSKMQSSTVCKSNVNSDNVNIRSNLVKLPKISIPIFSGKYTEWTTFHDLFVSLIHNNESLDNVQKLQYLKGYLTGEAEQLIRYIPVSDANYMQCWKQLKERYSNKKYLSNCILKRLLGQRNATSESASFLKELMDTSSDCLNALTNLGIDVSTWDIIVIHLLSSKLDAESRKQWELNVTTNVPSDSLPTFIQFKEFLTSRYRALEFIEPKYVNKPSTSYVKPVTNNNFSHTKVLHAANVNKISCEFCGEEHKICYCKEFASQDFEKRHEFVTSNRICYNCLGGNHGVRFCQKATNCRICNKRHHSLLHPTSVSSSTAHLGVTDQTVVAASEESSETSASRTEREITPITSHTATACCAKRQVSNQVLLATALIEAEAKTGQYQVIRALLDQGSQASFVTESVVQGLGLQKIPIKNKISGLGGNQSSTMSKYMVQLKIKSRTDPTFAMELNAYVLNNITTYLPGKRIALETWVELERLCLADPTYNIPNKIDILLGAEVYSQILKEGVRRGPSGSPVAQCTALGWILSGSVSSTSNESITVLHTNVEGNEIIKRFWELESEPLLKSKMFTQEEQRCEDIFSSTTSRSEDGRYVVKLPFHDCEPACKKGESREIAVKRLKALERKFAKDEVFKGRYTDVINEYLQLDHMAVVPEEAKGNQSVYLPHHAVTREDKSTSKVRVVFDASCKNENGVSLNDDLITGPTLQPDLRHLITSWRKHPVCLIADIVKMYRMVRVADEDCDYQRILWRNQPEEEIRDYKLLTVTFGTAAAPYLAVKALNQVGVDYKDKYPVAAGKVATDFYMDDLMTGCQTLQEGIHLYKEIDELLKEGGFILHKWSSNNEELLTILNARQNVDKEKENKNLDVKSDNIVKILGLTWNRSRDEFQYSVNLPPMSAPVTKRKIISDVSRLFDPLGWIAPCVIKAKVFIQQLWIAGTEWDEEPPQKILENWYTYRTELDQLTEFCMPRWLCTTLNDEVVELHGFADASNIAYAAVVYLRVVTASGHVRVNLVGAKTKVAPVKQVSIPRLELCGATLLAKLLAEMSQVLNIPKSNIRAWTDSTVVLAWLNKHPSNWKTFVANRVSEIISTLEPSQWSHVPTKENPADCASRGLKPVELIHHTLWKNGPNFLNNKIVQYTRLNDRETHLEQSIKSHCAVVEDSILNKYSSLQRLLRVVAYCKRFLTKKNMVTGNPHLSVPELNAALTTCIKIAQTEGFYPERKDIERHGSLTLKTCKIFAFTPFIDAEGVLRVGGRLGQSNESESVKHPILLPHKSGLSNLLVRDAHEKTLHGGVQLMLNYLRSAYCIVGVKHLVKNYVRKCVSCVRYKANIQTQLMGSLPSARVTPARAFIRCGVDYAGPISLRTSKGRGHKSYKGYIALFVCMVTRAVHIELVSDLSSRGFLEAYKRFISRRGRCLELYSDNGTNFVGASRELKELFDVENSAMIQEISRELATTGTTWHFIPPRAPNFGGLWEASVKSTKFHLKRVIGDSTLTYEELATLLSQIEACLNSRPISVLSNDPSEPSPLTPGHFLIGEPLVTIPEVNYENSNIGTLRRWQLTQRMLQDFWRRWSYEYLSNLLHRYKWANKTPEAEVGDVVLVKEDDLPPSKWLFGRVLQKHPGSDGLTRVVSLKCKNSVIKRPTSKICILPVTDSRN